MRKKIVFTDLDGTLLQNDQSISNKDLDALAYLSQNNIYIVAATGRSIHKIKSVVPEGSYFDYVIFSNGAGVQNWNNGEVLLSREIHEEDVDSLVKLLIGLKKNFKVSWTVPTNHYFDYHQSYCCKEFEKYIVDNSPFNKGSRITHSFKRSAAQLLVIIPNEDRVFNWLKEYITCEVPSVDIIRSTSPNNEAYIWFEIFPKGVSKGDAAMWMCDSLDIEYKDTMGIGNDFNDISLLDFTELSFIVDNAPKSLKDRYTTTCSNTENGFHNAVLQFVSNTN